MNRLTVFCLLALLAFPASAATPGDEVADRLTAASVKQEIASNDPRLAQTRLLLNKAVQLTAESPAAIASACKRYAGHLHDASHIEATPLELLDALAGLSTAGKPINDTLQQYAVARKAAPSHSHADAMAALGRK